MTSLTPETLLELFDDVGRAVASAVGAMTADERQEPGGRPTQYALDLVADEAALRVLEKAPVAVVSEESGRGGTEAAEVVVVLDPVDGSSNCSRGNPYWSTSLAAVDGDGLLAAMVVSHTIGATYTAVRGGGSRLNDQRLGTPAVRPLDDAIVAAAWADRLQQRTWGGLRILGSAALELCEVAAGSLDGWVDAVGILAPWDYLGALLVCRETGVTVIEHQGRELVETSGDARRQLVASASPELLTALQASVP